MGIINATDRDGTEHLLQGRERISLMEILRRAGLSVEALCNGSCQCATCHIYVDETWLEKLKPPMQNEADVLELEAENVRPNSRLACQIPWHDELDGIRLAVAPEET